MHNAACRPGWDETLNLADAMGRHGFAHAASALDLSPEARRRAAAMALATVEDVEDALQALGRQIGADRAEETRLALLRGMKGKIDGLLEMATA